MSNVTIDSSSDLVLLVLHASGGRLSGITRLQKLVFLISQDPTYQDLAKRREAPTPAFRPYKMGPFTPELYEAVEVLSSFEPPLIIATSPQSSIAAAEDVETEAFVESYDLDEAQPLAAVGLQPASFALTSPGRRVADALWQGAPPQLRSVVQSVVRTYGHLPLRELLRRVYREHESWTTKSEIKAQLGLSGRQ